MLSVRNAAYVASSQGLKVLTSFASLAILSRLLTPADFGVFALVTAVVGIAELFRDFGLSLAAIQASEISRQERSNLFWANSTIGLLLTVLTVLLAPLISKIYGQLDVSAVIAAVAVTFTINGMSAQYRVDLVRSARFRQIAITDTLSPVIALLAAVGGALLGFGVYSLVLQALSLALVTLGTLVGFSGWLPRLPDRSASIRSFVGVGSQLLLVQIISYFSNNIDKVLVGRIYGAASLGFYSRAFTLYLQPLNQMLAPFTNLIVASLSKLRDVPADYMKQLLGVQLVTNYAGFSAFGFVAGSAPSVVPLLLGPNWHPSIPILQVLCVGGAFQLLGFVYYWHFLASGNSQTFLTCTLISQPLAIALVLATSNLGLLGIAWGVSGGFFVEWLVPAVWGMGRTVARPWLLLRNALKPVVIAIAVTLGSTTGSLLLEDRGSLLQLAGSAALAVACGALMVALVPPIRHDFRRASATARARLRGRSAVAEGDLAADG